MTPFSRWGFSRAGWRHGARGEYWVVAQAALFIGYCLLPVYPGPSTTNGGRFVWWAHGMGGLLALAGVVLAAGAVRSLGSSLTPLPHPRDDATLVESGPYRFVRHPIYGGVVLLAAGIALSLMSWPHAAGSAVLLAFFTAKARREEAWLRMRFARYAEYAARTKRFIPYLF